MTRRKNYVFFDQGAPIGMTVSDLMAILSHFPPEMKVVTPDFDEGNYVPVCVQGFVSLRHEVGKAQLFDDPDGEPCLILNFA